MITFLACPKSFEGEIGRIQKLAIRSWLATDPQSEVILYGEYAPSGVIDSRVLTVPQIATSKSKVPLFDAIAAHAVRGARFDTQVFLNCDILVPPTFARAIAPIRFKSYLLTGQRINMARGAQFNINASGWREELSILLANGQVELFSVAGMDYFVFQRGLWSEIQPVIIGRGGYDGALMAYCLRRGIPIIDGTIDLNVVHQFHGYSHIVGGKTEAYNGSDADANYALHDVRHSTPNVADADYVLLDGACIPYKCRGDIVRRTELFVKYKLKRSLLSLMIRAAWRLLKVFTADESRHPTLNDVLRLSPSNLLARLTTSVAAQKSNAGGR